MACRSEAHRVSLLLAPYRQTKSEVEWRAWYAHSTLRPCCRWVRTTYGRNVGKVQSKRRISYFWIHRRSWIVWLVRLQRRWIRYAESNPQEANTYCYE